MEDVDAIVKAQLEWNKTHHAACEKCGSIESLAHGFGGDASVCAKCGGKMIPPTEKATTTKPKRVT